eukprot:SAG11_NODE_31831_length_288_cov_2.142857_1_plen_49_part_10
MSTPENFGVAQLFNELDTDGDGVLSRAEFMAAMAVDGSNLDSQRSQPLL